MFFDTQTWAHPSQQCAPRPAPNCPNHPARNVQFLPQRPKALPRSLSWPICIPALLPPSSHPVPPDSPAHLLSPHTPVAAALGRLSKRAVHLASAEQDRGLDAASTSRPSEQNKVSRSQASQFHLGRFSTCSKAALF